MKTIGDKLRSLMAEKDITSADLARTIGVNASYISQLLTGYREPGKRTLIKLADALGVDINFLLTISDIIGVEVVGTINKKGVVSLMQTGETVPVPPGYTSDTIKHKAVYALRITGDISPVLKDGWTLYLAPSTPDKLKAGDFVLFEGKQAKELKEVRQIEQGVLTFAGLDGSVNARHVSEVPTVDRVLFIMP